MCRSFRLLLIALAGLVLGLPQAQSVGAGGSAATAQVQAKPRADARPSLPVAIQNDIQRIARALETANRKQPSPIEEERAKRDLQAQEDMAHWAKWTVGLFITATLEMLITAAGVFLVWRTLLSAREGVKEAKRAADAAENTVIETRRVGQAQVRAYLACESGSYSIEGSRATIWPKFYNSGQSPAKNVRIWGHIRVLEAHSEESKIGDSLTQEGRAPPIPSGESESAWISFELDKPAGLRDALIRDRFRFALIATFSWEDVFGETQVMRLDLKPIPASESYGHDENDAWRTGEMHAHNVSLRQGGNDPSE